MLNNPSRALKPDAQGFDRVEIVTVPRYKTSGLSGDEWRISAEIVFYRKGVEVHREGRAANIERACAFVAYFHARACDEAHAYYAGERDVCDQEGCCEPAKWKHVLLAKFSNDGHRSESNGAYRLFCDRHKTRGDCGLEDADKNYTVEPFTKSPTP